ncbi:MAG: Rieske 2Fe-2S domain-containing protein [Nitrososphaera sp.]|uniref:Rieske 2Fe-2S domain-containing protein n=1 Tax=Nitrososphaera sp. TaxID=1971748 RepID=UPI003D6EE8BE
MSSVENYQKVANKKDLKEGGLLKVEPEGKPIVLAMVGGRVYAIDAVCTHQGGPLEEGNLEGNNLTCPWHYAVFDVRSGNVSDKTGWATDLDSYPVQVDESSGDISVNAGSKAQQQGKAGSESKSGNEDSDRKFYEEEERKVPDDSKLYLQLLEKEKLEGTDIMTFKLDRLGGKALQGYSAGQFAYFKLEGVVDDAKGPIRHFSLASSPTEQDFILISTRIRDTPYKQKLASLEKGAKILAWGPEGEFILHKDNSKPAVLLSGGIGVTPFRSMTKYATDERLPLKIVMFDSNRDAGNILYKTEFDRWVGEKKNLKVVYTITEEEKQDSSWAGERGRINKEMIARYLSNDEISNAVFYVCGPPGMLQAMQKLLKEELQIPKDRIKLEEFTGY